MCSGLIASTALISLPCSERAVAEVLEGDSDEREVETFASGTSAGSTEADEELEGTGRSDVYKGDTL